MELEHLFPAKHDSERIGTRGRHRKNKIRLAEEMSAKQFIIKSKCRRNHERPRRCVFLPVVVAITAVLLTYV